MGTARAPVSESGCCPAWRERVAKPNERSDWEDICSKVTRSGLFRLVRSVKKGIMDQTQALRDQLVDLLTGENAHANFEKSVKNIPHALRGKRPAPDAHSPWELLEHLRIAQWDILEFSRNPKHKSPEWPEGYWPKSPERPDAEAWDHSIVSF